jgi:3-methyladenine DNA glycosylase AlkD
MATIRTTKKPAAKTATKPTAARMSLDEVMRALEKAGSAKTKKTYARHGAKEPMFGVQFGTLKVLVDRIGVDQDLALALWKTKNQDARNLAMKIADPAKIRSADLDRWAKENSMRMCGMYIASLAAESPHAAAKLRDWLASSDEELRATGWTLVAQMANLDEKTPDDWFAKRLAHRAGRSRPRRNRMQDSRRRDLHRQAVGAREEVRIAGRRRTRSRVDAHALLRSSFRRSTGNCRGGAD